MKCPDCEGTGRIASIARVAGEAFDADITETRCDECGGTGEVEAVCDFCDGELVEGFCAACEEWVEVEHLPERNGRARIAA